MKALPHADHLHLVAAEGWLELGDVQSASDELEAITPTLRAHPYVLKLRVRIYLQARKRAGVSAVSVILV